MMFVALGIAVAVFVADRAFPGGSPAGPSKVQAASGELSVEPVAEPPVFDDRETQAAEVRTALARRLDTVARSHRLESAVVKDAFFPSPDWVGPQDNGGKVVVDEEPVVDSAEVKAQEFARMHQLKGAIVASGRSIAIIDGNCVSLGGVVDGFELKSVTSDTAVLTCEGATVVLRLNSDDQKKIN
ncbi:MAG: hypothetical protein GY794_25365 [bacterium]|nr:hypothetical protein [bacterium]